MSFRATFIAAAILMAAIGAASSAYSSPGDGGCYIAESGDCVPYPQKGGPQPPTATAQCADGSWSFSEHPHKRRHMPRPRRRAAVFVAPSKAARGHILGTTWARIALRCDTLRYAFPQLDGGLTA
ncbi:DUF3761 domain-containing protein [Mycobacterium sp.]|uniref:DUF3761 domain-containing protein n=1 Tax=Mycobacterium sp. TaxID=1785 RepID=UPI003C77BB5F